MVNRHDIQQRASDSFTVPSTKLTPLPRRIRYLDEFTNTWQSSEIDEIAQSWNLRANAEDYGVNFCFTDERMNALIRRWTIWKINHLSVPTLALYNASLIRAAQKIGEQRLLAVIFSEPMDLERTWHEYLVTELSAYSLSGIKSLLTFLCQFSIGTLKPGHARFIDAFRLPRRDSYAAVRSGAVFLSAREEALIVEYLDLLNEQVVSSDPGALSSETLRDACILCVSYQYAMRPIQIARVRLSDVRSFDNGEGAEYFPVHVTFLRAKQRSDGARLPTTRKIKREWCPIFLEWGRRRNSSGIKHSTSKELRDFFFGMSPREIGHRILATTSAVAGKKRAANHLRHSAAQRLVNAGASQEELAEFMGHTALGTGLVYFDISPTQADRVNKALAISPTYKTVASIASSRTIDIDALRDRPFDQQIGGVPHGIPIAGIGACNLGQSLCSKNPVTSCYTCPKFLPVNRESVHQGVLESLRPVVRQFETASRGDTPSPAFMQLRQTLSAVQTVLASLEPTR